MAKSKTLNVDHGSLVELQDLVVECVGLTRSGLHGCMLHVKLKDGRVFVMAQRLYEEGKQKFAQFKRKYRLSQAAAIDMFS